MWEGKIYDPNGPYNMGCYTTGGGCVGCEVPSVNDDFISATDIARVVEAASAAQVAAVVEAYGDRLLLNVRRSLLVVRGTACDPNALVAFVFVSQAKSKAYERLGVPSLQQFFALEAGPSEWRVAALQR
jgi:hypothetical protein